ncbi:hypothetical protein CP8484711_0505A, partial [Chlamydia psittaci 84-8471/1]
MNTHIL